MLNKTNFVVRNGLIFIMWLVVLAFWSAQATAKEATKPPTEAPKTSYEELAKLRSENAVLAEKVKQLELVSKLKSNNSPNFPNSPKLPAIKNQTDVNSARVEMVTGVGKSLVAVISTDMGNISARVGTTIPNLGRVTSIRVDEVMVVRGKLHYSVPFANEPSINSAGNLPSATQSTMTSPQMPFVPSMPTSPPQNPAPIMLLPGGAK